MYCALDIAKYVLGYYCIKKDSVCSNLKLQKILYFLQANHLVETAHPLFEDEIEAVDFGPIIWPVYKKYIAYGAGSIPFDIMKDSKCWNLSIYKKDQKIMNELLDELEPYSATNLLDIIHKQSPWKNAYYGPAVYKVNKNTGKLERKTFISNESLYEYFKD